MSTILIPPNYITLESKPLIFLAGPIQGTTDWQSIAVNYLIEKAPTVYVASPRRTIKFEGEFSAQMYAEQVDWETHHLRHAGKFGVILFWLAKESEHNPNRAYAQTTRFELAEWKMKHEYENVKIVIGIEEGFSGAKYIRRRLSQDCPNIKIFSTLKETCDYAITLLK
ncbi:MAG: nucleoside 2-deoxyribosyltransferase domain-containing protein [Candidatus Woesearchaeota archaeon]